MKNKNTLPLVSVIIPTYNSKAFIPSSVGSAINQTYPNIEILIIDDGSTDNTEEIVEQLPGSVRYIRQANSGPSAARNRGIRESCGKYIAFLDVDDAWKASKVAEQVHLFENSDDLSIVATGYERCDTELLPIEIVSINPLPKGKGIIPFRLLLEKNQLLTSSIMTKKEALDTCGLFNEQIQFGEDWDLWVRIAQLGAIGYISPPLCKYRAHGAGLTGKLNNKNMSDWLEVIEKNRLRTNNWYDRVITYRKSLSWYFYNYAYLERVRGEKSEGKRKAVKSMAIWPFSKRTPRIIKGLFA